MVRMLFYMIKGDPEGNNDRTGGGGGGKDDIEAGGRDGGLDEREGKNDRIGGGKDDIKLMVRVVMVVVRMKPMVKMVMVVVMGIKKI